VFEARAKGQAPQLFAGLALKRAASPGIGAWVLTDLARN